MIEKEKNVYKIVKRSQIEYISNDDFKLVSGYYVYFKRKFESHFNEVGFFMSSGVLSNDLTNALNMIEMHRYENSVYTFDIFYNLKEETKTWFQVLFGKYFSKEKAITEYNILQSCQTTICEISGMSCVYSLKKNKTQFMSTDYDSWERVWHTKIHDFFMDIIIRDVIEESVDVFKIEVF